MQQAGRQSKGILAFLLSPSAFWLFLFFIAPLIVVLVVSFGKRSLTGLVEYTFTLDNYIRVFSEPIYLRILWKSVWLAIVNTVLCLLMLWYFPQIRKIRNGGQ